MLPLKKGITVSPFLLQQYEVFKLEERKLEGIAEPFFTNFINKVKFKNQIDYETIVKDITAASESTSRKT